MKQGNQFYLEVQLEDEKNNLLDITSVLKVQFTIGNLIKIYDGTNGALPTNNTKEYKPHNDYEPATCLYVNKTHYQNMPGYKMSGTQILKNVNGQIMWQDQ